MDGINEEDDDEDMNESEYDPFAERVTNDE